MTLQPLKPDDHVIIQASGRTLQIKEAQVSDTGRYTCLASNIAGEDEMEFDVNIQGNQSSDHKILLVASFSNVLRCWNSL